MNLFILKKDKATAVQSIEMPESDPIGRVLFGLKSGSIQEAAVVLLKDAKNPRPGPSLYRVIYYQIKSFN
jgi:hypothetical protein